MPYSIEIIRTEDFVRVDSRKHPNLQSGREALRVIGEACRTRGINRVLIDSRRVEVPLTVPEMYFLASAFADVGFPRSVWIAILPREDRFDRAQFAALCAQNRGWIAKPVRSFEEAMAWFSETEGLEGHNALNGNQAAPAA